MQDWYVMAVGPLHLNFTQKRTVLQIWGPLCNVDQR